MRAIAVTLVLLFHLWPNRLSGGFIGVDVFFVISGFLITSHLLAAVPETGKDLARFWARRIQRLLPASLLVLATTLLGTWAFAPDTRWASSAWDTVAAAFYVVNWRLASTSVDYLQAQDAPSPVQHFWSLSVEEQFYVMWPVLILVLALLAVRLRRQVAPVVRAGLLVVVVASLVYSVQATRAEPASAYFVTPTRIWELGVGGLLAAFLSRRAFGVDRTDEGLPMPAPARSALAWVGLAAIAWSAWSYTSATPFPSWRALLPVLGAAAVIGAACDRGLLSPGSWLALRPVQWMGDISYSVYLWHWPMVVLVPYATGHDLTTLDKVGIIGCSYLVAHLTKNLVEDRFRAARWGRPLRKPFLLGLAGMLVVGAAGVGLDVVVKHEQAVAQAQVEQALSGDRPCFGAAALAAPSGSCNPVTAHGPVVPAPAQAATDKSNAYDGDCWAYPPFHHLKTCTFGDPHGTTSVLLLGNSHAGQWLPALEEIGRRQHWKITTVLTSECTQSTAMVAWDAPAKGPGCLGWARKAMRFSLEGKYDLIVTSARNSHAVPDKTRAASLPDWRRGFTTWLKPWAERRTPVVVIHDTPYPGNTMGAVPDCVAQHLDDLGRCGGTRSEWVSPDPLVQAAQHYGRPFTTVDLTDKICTPVRCPAVVGGVVTYFDSSHISATYAKTLAQFLVPPINQAMAGGGR
jgi:peptidoglycan/LPS O-acetylase OafA/YrhL